MVKGGLYKQVKDFFIRNFDIKQDKADELQSIEFIKKGIEFKGANLWILIFATFIASLGLNINSTAVIIGAMLITPLLGPLMGFGLGLGIVDVELIKSSLRNFAIAIIVGVLTSTFYFLITPFSEAQSELLAQTTPTLYDVLIAFFGGFAGIIACSTKNKGTVIPGVAIATALIPPLCTAGYGLASGQIYYFLGAIYLFFINSVFISLATYLVVRLLKYPKKVILDKQRQKRVSRYVGIIVFFTIVPSLFLSYNLIRSSYFNDRVNEFISNELNFPNTQVLNTSITNTREKKEIKAILIGDPVAEEKIDSLRLQLDKYGLKGTGLSIQQGFNQETDINELKNLLMHDLYNNSEEVLKLQSIQIDSLRRNLDSYKNYDQLTSELIPELKILFPSVEEASCSHTYIINTETQHTDTVMMVYLKSKTKLGSVDEKKLQEWISARTNMENIKLLIE